MIYTNGYDLLQAYKAFNTHNDYGTPAPDDGEAAVLSLQRMEMRLDFQAFLSGESVHPYFIHPTGMTQANYDISGFALTDADPAEPGWTNSGSPYGGNLQNVNDVKSRLRVGTTSAASANAATFQRFAGRLGWSSSLTTTNAGIQFHVIRWVYEDGAGAGSKTLVGWSTGADPSFAASEPSAITTPFLGVYKDSGAAEYRVLTNPAGGQAATPGVSLDGKLSIAANMINEIAVCTVGAEGKAWMLPRVITGRVNGRNTYQASPDPVPLDMGSAILKDAEFTAIRLEHNNGAGTTALKLAHLGSFGFRS